MVTQSNVGIQSVSMPRLEEVVGGIQIDWAPSLHTLHMPVLQTLGFPFGIEMTVSRHASSGCSGREGA